MLGRVARRSFHVSSRASGHVKRRATAAESPLATAFKVGDDGHDDDDRRMRYTAQNPDIPNLQGLSKRWHKMDHLDQEEVIIYLDDKGRGDWKELTKEEKQAMWFVNYGPWGPRAPQPDDPGSIYGHVTKAIFAAIVGVSGYKAYEHYSKE